MSRLLDEKDGSWYNCSGSIVVQSMFLGKEHEDLYSKCEFLTKFLPFPHEDKKRSDLTHQFALEAKLQVDKSGWCSFRVRICNHSKLLWCRRCTMGEQARGAARGRTSSGTRAVVQPSGVGRGPRTTGSASASTGTAYAAFSCA